MITKNTIFFALFCLSYPALLFLSIQDPLQDPFDIKKEIPQVFDIQEIIEREFLYIEREQEPLLEDIRRRMPDGMYLLFLNDLGKLHLGGLTDTFRNFSLIINNSSSIEDLLYYFYVHHDGSHIFRTLSGFDIEQKFTTPVEKFLNNEFIRSFKNHKDLSSFLKEGIEKNFLVPVVGKFKELTDRLNAILTEDFFVERMMFLKAFLPNQIEEQKESLNVLKTNEDFQQAGEQEFFNDWLQLHEVADSYVKALNIEQIVNEKKFDKNLDDKNFSLIDRLRKVVEEKELKIRDEHHELLREKINQYNSIGRKIEVLRSVYIPMYLAIYPQKKPKISNRVKALVLLSFFVGGAGVYYLLPRLFPQFSLRNFILSIKNLPTNLRELFLEKIMGRRPIRVR